MADKPERSSEFRDVGDTVVIDWGLDEVQAKVIEVYGSGLLARVRVEVPILGASGEALDDVEISLPLDAVRPA